MIFLIFFETRRSRQGETVYLQGNTGHRKRWKFKIQNSEFKGIPSTVFSTGSTTASE